MATINLEILRQTDGDRPNPNIYTDLRLDLKLDYTLNDELAKNEQIKDLKVDNNLGAIRNALINLLTTSPGEKPLNPVFGINFGDLLFLPVNEIRGQTIGNVIIENFEKFEPRIKILNVEITPLIDVQEYVVNITYTVPRFNNRPFKIKGTLSKTGFYV